MMSLAQLTNFLMDDLHRLKDIFYEEKSDLDKKSFFNYVKKDSKKIFDALNEWEHSALDYVKSNKSKVTFQQIIATKENIELIILHSYYKDIRKRRYMEYFSSSVLVLKLLYDEIKS